MYKCSSVLMQRFTSHPSTCVMHSFGAIFPWRQLIVAQSVSLGHRANILRAMLSMSTHRCIPSLSTALVVCSLIVEASAYGSWARAASSTSGCPWGSASSEHCFARHDECCTILELASTIFLAQTERVLSWRVLERCLLFNCSMMLRMAARRVPFAKIFTLRMKTLARNTVETTRAASWETRRKWLFPLKNTSTHNK